MPRRPIGSPPFGRGRGRANPALYKIHARAALAQNRTARDNTTMPRNAKTPLAVLALALGWALTVLVGYYRYHKPLQADQLGAPLMALLDLFAALAMLLAAGGVGRRLLPAARQSPLERFALQAAAGMGALGLVWLGLGGLRLYNRPAALIFTAALLALTHKAWRAWLAELGALGALWQTGGRLERWLAVLSALLAAMQLPWALCPPTRWDALTYHLQLPRLFVEHGRLAWIADNPYWGQAQLGEMLFTWAAALLRVETAAVFAWLAGVVLLIGVIGWTTRLAGSGTAGWMTAAALLCGATPRALLGWGYTDLLAALMGLAAFICLSAWLEEGTTAHLAWLGVFVGLAAGVKLTAAILAPGVYLFALWHSGRQRGAWRAVLMAAALSLLVFSPWTLKNGLASGNPLYPYFGSAYWSVGGIDGGIKGIDPLEGALLPLLITWRGVDHALPYSTDVGALLLLFAPAGVWAGRKNAAVRAALLCLLLGWAGMLIGGSLDDHLRQARLFFVLLPAAGLVCGLGWAALQGAAPAGVRLRRLGGALALLVLALAVWQELGILWQGNPLAVISGVRPRQDYLDDRLGWYAPAMRSLHALPPGSKPLLLWEGRGLYAPAAASSDVWINRWQMDWERLGSPQAVLSAWKQQGYTHVMVYRFLADLLRQQGSTLPPAGWQAFDDLLQRLPPPVALGGIYELYTLP
ncbi:MAG: DUF2029 domain-containing protein [Anaerolineae bacterium]|nr:DUF2029 domain-containing protein [Anaerolineae bacterium]